MAVADLAGAPLVDAGSASTRHRRKESLPRRVLGYLPQGNMLDEAVWRKRHNILQWLLLLHLPALTLFGFYMKHPAMTVLITVAPIVVFRVLGGLPTGRRLASFFTTAGIVYCSAALVSLSNGAIEAHFHFFIIVGFIALYQDWVPFGWNIVFTVLSHGLGSTFRPDMMFNHASAMQHPWTWSLIHGAAVLAACVGVVLFWRTNEDEQRKTLALTQDLSDAEINRRRFASELLVNLARRNQSLLYRQLEIINQLEHAEQDPDALSGLFRLDHLATRIRRNAENLLVLSGEEPPRVWGKPVALTDVVRAAIAETEDLSRVSFIVDERLAVLGQAVIDLTHLLAELIENAVRSSPPDSLVTIRTTPDVRSPGTVMLTVEDWGVGMPPAQLVEANAVLAAPRDVDALVSNRLGLHVVARLASRYAIQVVLTATSGSGITAVVLLPPDLFTSNERQRPAAPSGQFTTLARPNAAPMALESGPLPQRNPRLNGSSVRSGGPITGAASTSATTSANTSASTSANPWAGAAAKPSAHNGSANSSANGSAEAPLRGPITAQAGPPPAVPTPTAGLETRRTGPNWDGWWEAETTAQTALRSPSDAQAPEPPDGNQPAGRPDSPPSGIGPGVTLTVSEAHSSPMTPDVPLRLSRRVPQTHLAPELHRDHQDAERNQAAPVPAAPPADAARAREALSRYQASRRAALAENDTSERN